MSAVVCTLYLIILIGEYFLYDVLNILIVVQQQNPFFIYIRLNDEMAEKR